MGLADDVARTMAECNEYMIQQATRIVDLEIENDSLRRTVEDLRRQLKAPPY